MVDVQPARRVAEGLQPHPLAPASSPRNVVDLMTLQSASEHPHGLSDHDCDALFTTDKPIIFAFHEPDNV